MTLCGLSPILDMCDARLSLGFIIRLAKEFQLNMSIKILYCALVRSILEYCCVVLDPDSDSDSKQLELVQSKFLRFDSFVLKIPCPIHDYSITLL